MCGGILVFTTRERLATCIQCVEDLYGAQDSSPQLPGPNVNGAKIETLWPREVKERDQEERNCKTKESGG